MNRAMKKNYVKPQTVCVCAEVEHMLLAASPGVSNRNVDVDNWNEDESSNLGSETIDVSGNLW